MTLWVKWWCDALDDPKLMRAARKGAEQLTLLPWLLVYAKRADDDGRLTVNGEPADPEDIARSLPGVPSSAVATALRELEAIGVLSRDEHDVLSFVTWDARAATRPSDSRGAVAERVRRHRKRKAASRTGALGNDGETSRNALHHVTEKRHATRQSGERERRAETESERESGDGEREVSATASFSPASQLPPAAIELLGHIQREKQPQVEQEMRQVLNGGCAYRRQRISASAARLDAKCRESLIAIAARRIRNPATKAWAFTLAKLADTSDGSAPGAIAAQAEQREREHDTTDTAQDSAKAEAWLAEQPPDVAATIERQLAAQGCKADGGAFMTLAYQSAREALVIRAYRAAQLKRDS